MSEETQLLRTALAAAEAELLTERSALRAAEEAHLATIAQMQKATAELEQFAYVTSHDLQAPLRNITGFSQLLLKRYKAAMPPEAQDFLAYIQASVKHMQTLIEDLLAFSRVGRMPEVSQQAAPLAATLERALAPLAATVKAAGATVEWGELPTVVADHKLLSQAFTNLLDNAIKFQPPGQAAKVQVSALQDGGHWVVTVSDNGIGLPGEHLEDIFAVFRRLHTQEEYPGTGIGLAIAHKVAGHHNATLWAESDGLGQGARFKLRLPIERRGEGRRDAAAAR